MKNLPGSGYDSSMFSRKIVKRESAVDPSGTVTTAAATALKADANDLTVPDGDNGRRASGSNV